MITRANIHRVTILLKWLSMGGEVSHNGSTYTMDENGAMAVKCKYVIFEDGKEVATGDKYLGHDMLVQDLIQIAAALTDDYFYTLAAQVALNDSK